MGWLMVHIMILYWGLFELLSMQLQYCLKCAKQLVCQWAVQSSLQLWVNIYLHCSPKALSDQV